MNTLPYATVSRKAPILTVMVRNLDLTTVNSVGVTGLYVKRVGDYAEYVMYPAFEIRGNRFSFALDDLVFNRAGGRFQGRLVYKGLEIETLQFIYKPDVVELVGSTNV